MDSCLGVSSNGKPSRESVSAQESLKQSLRGWLVLKDEEGIP